MKPQRKKAIHTKKRNSEGSSKIFVIFKSGPKR